MTVLGLGRSGAPASEVAASFRGGWIRHFRLALSSAGGAAVVLAGFTVLRAEPDKAFDLLRVWGPAFLIAMLAIVVLGKFLEGLNTTVRESFNVVATSAQASAAAAGRQADALTRLADQGNKQAEEVRRLAIYAAREFPAVYDRFDQLDASIRELTDGVKGLHWAVNVKGAHGEEVTNERGA